MTLATGMDAGTAGGALALLLAGCAGPPATAAPPVDRPTCSAQQDLAGVPDRGYDHKHRGPSSAQAQALGPDRPPGFVPERARAACRDVVATLRRADRRLVGDRGEQQSVNGG